ncbi:hypothetical protein [Methylosinus sp. Sm6]|uniref:hypothetical protein n=1 Tax=Methylosinus sp. Sm6 TaxID=2866948 RepID=UPI002104ED56|nr:hypothetical protein [Methylosinus sp. Sm6]
MKAIPLVGVWASRKRRNAPNPPAEAPIPTIGKVIFVVDLRPLRRLVLFTFVSLNKGSVELVMISPDLLHPVARASVVRNATTHISTSDAARIHKCGKASLVEAFSSE